MNPRTVASAGPDFLASIPIANSLTEVLRGRNAVELPTDWYVALADVVGSTAAIERGKYKEVNSVAASCIAAVRNAIRPFEAPFVFGGDGASLCIPPDCTAAAGKALRSAKTMAQQQFGLDLRVGIVSYARVREAGSSILLSRLRVSENIHQAVFLGGGMDMAETLLKAELAGQTQLPRDSAMENHDADFSGVECRWESLPSREGETISLLFKAMPTDNAEAADVYERVLAMLAELYGDEQALHPFNKSSLQLTLDDRLLNAEVGVRSYDWPKWQRRFYRTWLKLQIRVGKFIMARGLVFKNADWSHYRDDLISNADYRKMDDCLRMVISSSPENRAALEAALKERFRPDELAYGIHVSKAALMTCLIDQYEGEHFHFIDGDDGGYATAARMMKAQLGELKAKAG